MYRIQEEAFFSSRFSLTWHRDKCIFSAGERSNFSVSGNKLLNGAGIRPSGRMEEWTGEIAISNGQVISLSTEAQAGLLPSRYLSLPSFPHSIFSSSAFFFFQMPSLSSSSLPNFAILSIRLVREMQTSDGNFEMFSARQTMLMCGEKLEKLATLPTNDTSEAPEGPTTQERGPENKT